MFCNSCSHPSEALVNWVKTSFITVEGKAEIIRYKEIQVQYFWAIQLALNSLAYISSAFPDSVHL